jgi:hypothetical protein
VNRTWPYVYTDTSGDEMRIAPVGGTSALAQVSCAVPVEIPPANLPAVVAALYEAAGLPAPVILDRAEIYTSTGVNVFQVSSYEGTVYLGRGSIEQPGEMAPGVARKLAAVLAAHADAADKHDAGRLADLRRIVLGCLPGTARSKEEIAGDIARALLAAGCSAPDEAGKDRP